MNVEGLDALKQLVPPEQWVTDSTFLLLDSGLTFAVDLMGDGTMILEEDVVRCRWRGRGIGVHNVLNYCDTRTAIARALALVLMAECHPGEIDARSCRI